MDPPPLKTENSLPPAKSPVSLERISSPPTCFSLTCAPQTETSSPLDPAVTSPVPASTTLSCRKGQPRLSVPPLNSFRGAYPLESPPKVCPVRPPTVPLATITADHIDCQSSTAQPTRTKNRPDWHISPAPARSRRDPPTWLSTKILAGPIWPARSRSRVLTGQATADTRTESKPWFPQVPAAPDGARRISSRQNGPNSSSYPSPCRRCSASHSKRK